MVLWSIVLVASAQSTFTHTHTQLWQEQEQQRCLHRLITLSVYTHTDPPPSLCPLLCPFPQVLTKEKVEFKVQEEVTDAFGNTIKVRGK
jgi:hypothetical protein